MQVRSAHSRTFRAAVSFARSAALSPIRPAPPRRRVPILQEPTVVGFQVSTISRSCEATASVAQKRDIISNRRRQLAVFQPSPTPTANKEGILMRVNGSIIGTEIQQVVSDRQCILFELLAKVGHLRFKFGGEDLSPSLIRVSWVITRRNHQPSRYSRKAS